MTISRISFITVLTFLLIIDLSLTSCISSGNVNSPGNIKMTLTIGGLQKGEQATLTISHEIVTAEDPLFVKTVTGNGEKSLTLDVSINLKDGFYQLLLEAPDKYFREPKGYLFAVTQSQILNPTGRNVIFNLLPQPESPTAEAYISLSAPPKQGGRPVVSVKGLISGLMGDDTATELIYYANGEVKSFGPGKRNGPWESWLDDTGRGDYIVTMVADGYTVQPESYRVRIIGIVAYVVKNNEVGEESLDLDFHFTPGSPPPPLPPAPGTPGFANDDIVSAPGGFTYRASIHQEGQPDWPPVPVSEIALNTSLGSVSIMYRSYIETLAGEARNNIINLDAKNAPKIADPLQVNYHVSLVGGITVSQGIKGYGGIGGQDRKSSQRVLVIHIEPWVQPGEYPFEIQVEYEGKNIGSLPVIVKVK